MKYIFSGIFLFYLAIFIFPTVSLAANLHVSPNGSGTACSDATPCSLNTANQKAKAGDRVLLRNGVYKTGIAPVNSGTSENKRIIFESAPGQKARIDFGYELTGWEKVSGEDGVDAIYRTKSPGEKNRLVWIDDYEDYGRNTGLWRRDIYKNRIVETCDCIERPGDYYISGGYIYLQTPDKDNPNNHRLIGASKHVAGTNYAIKLEGRKYITVRNLEFYHGFKFSDAIDAHYITLENNHFKNFIGTGMTIANESSYWIIRGNYFQGIGGINTHAADAIWIGSKTGSKGPGVAHHILIEDNVFRYTGHAAVATQYYAHHNVIRRNDFDLAWGKLTQGNGSFETWEHNSFRGSARASQLRLQHWADHGTHSFAHEGTIYRFNKTWQNAIGLAISQNRSRNVYGGVAYHNIIYGNIGEQHGSSGIHIPEADTRGWHLVNNIVANCQRKRTIGKTPNNNCVAFSRWSKSSEMRDMEPSMENNIIFSDKSSSVWDGGTVADAQSRFPNFFRNNIQEDPLFVNPTTDNPDFRLQAGSPAIDAGRFLALTTNAGTNEKIVKVDNAYFFMDGYGIVDGDEVKIGRNEPVRIIKVNYKTNELTLADAISWDAGDGVSFDYEGQAPDIGLHEYGAARGLVANDDRFEMTVNSVPVVHTVLSNDYGDGLKVVALTSANGGTAVLGGSGECIDGAQRCVYFTVDENFVGVATYSYTVEDNDGTQAQANVTVLVREEVVTPIVTNAIVFEAEDYTRNVTGESHSWEEVAFLGASSSAMQALDDLGNAYPNNYVGTSPQLDYVFHSVTQGTYYVWVRGHAQDSFSNDSVHVGVGGTANTDSEAIEFDGSDQWVWSNTRRFDRGRATVTLEEGEQEINLWMREDGAMFDKILLTQDPDFKPSGFGPESYVPEMPEADSGKDTNPPADQIDPIEPIDVETNEISVVSVEAPGTHHKPEHAPENVIDDDPTSYWATQTMPQKLVLDLGGDHYIGKTLVSFNKYDQGRIYVYSIEVSQDKSNWNTLVGRVQSGSSQWNENSYAHAYGRYIRLTVHEANNSNWSNVLEIKVFRGEESVPPIVDDHTPNEPSVPRWASVSFASLGAQPQELTFTSAMTITPSTLDEQIVLGLSNGDANAFDDLAAIIRLRNGLIQVRNGDRYTSLLDVPYLVGKRYHFTLTVDVVNRLYSVVMEHEGEIVEIARDYAFRTQQANVTSLNTFGIYTNSDAGHDVQGLRVREQTPESEKLAIEGAIASGYSRVEHIPAMAIDGDINTYWASFGTPQWIQLDLGRVKAVTKVRNAFVKYDRGRVYTYSVEGSLDGRNWHMLVNRAVSGDQLWTEESFSAFNARYILLTLHEGTDTEWASVTDMEIYGYAIQSESNPTEELFDLPVEGGHPPSKPVLVDINTVLTDKGYLFDVDGYHDQDGDELAQVEWQISTGDGFTTLVLERELKDRKWLVLPFGLLSDGDEYWVRTRHADVSGRWSEWSDAESFIAQETQIIDLDRNDIDDQYQVSTYVDSNRNGVDDTEENLCNLHDAEGDSVVGIQSDQGFVRCVTSLNGQDMGSESNDLPYGMFSFKVVGLPVNHSNPASVNVSLYFEQALPENSRWFKYDEVTGVMEEYQEEVSFNGHYVNIKLTDGGVGDADGVVNGVIIDPSGPLVPQHISEENTDTAVVDENTSSNITGNDSGGGGQLSWIFIALLMLNRFVVRRQTC